MSTTAPSTKRRFGDVADDYEQESPLYKRLNESVPSAKHPARYEQPAPMPAITYASPDYRPPVSPNALWLQPPQQQPEPSAMAVDEADSTDEDELTTLVQTPSSILDESIKGSLESGWSNGSLEQWHQV
ncbi:hypothetical protein BJV82DRAFT_652966 [Fennellomyces sp. T-0311]|nr:hypothetical protein BJV82DRAFT_652966 [Fennellomyces sp. T-0311]